MHQPERISCQNDACSSCSEINSYTSQLCRKKYQCLTCTLNIHITKADHVSAINTCMCSNCFYLIDPIDGFTVSGGGITCNHCINQIYCDNCHTSLDISKGCNSVNGIILCSACVYHPILGDTSMLRCSDCKKCFSSNSQVSVQSGQITCAPCTSTVFNADPVAFQQYVNNITDQGTGTTKWDVKHLPPIDLISQNTECVHNVNAPDCTSDIQYNVQMVKFGSMVKCCCEVKNCPFNTNVFINCVCKADLCKYLDSNSVVVQPFGFTPVKMLNQMPSHFTLIKPFNYLAISQILQNHKIPNSLGPKFLLPSPFNLPLWHFFLKKYWGGQLLSFLACGFPLDLHSKPTASKDFVNHSSAIKYGPHVQHYLDTELQHSAILGPFSKSPISGLHLSPIMTRPKQGADKRRVIIDLSWPKVQSQYIHGHPLPS